MKLAIELGVPEPPRPRNIETRFLVGVTVAITRNATARLRVDPRLTNVTLIPDAIPLSSGGTEFIIEALFGEANRPIPLPTKISGMARPGNVILGPIVVSCRK